MWLEQQSIKTAAAVFAQAGRVIDWHSQEEDPVRNSPRGRGTQTHFQAEVYFCMFHSDRVARKKYTRKISPFRSKFASRRPGLSALRSVGAVQQLAALCGATAPTILKAGNVISKTCTAL